ncbi:MAG: universal stress protein [Planctomycetes bacterium]|nr:universal stress protein [Planctomycetota bacterium]MCC7170576.1 universal stress protein [Planctomycetota bacterium]
MDILLYVDPSIRGEWALAAAKQMVPALRARLTLLATTEDVAQHPRLIEDANARLDRDGFTTRVAIRPGPAERAVLAESQAGAYALSIVPPAGRRALVRLFKGSRVATVVRSVKTSVLVARRPSAKFARVLVAVAGGKHSAATTLGAIEIARGLGARLTAIHIRAGVTLPEQLPLTERREARQAVESPTEDFDQHAKVRELLQQSGVPFDIVVRDGLIVDELLAEIEEGGHDLLIIGAHRPEGAPTWMLDDVTERVLLRCPIPILVLRAPEP